MSASQPSEEEENQLFSTGGFRFRPALERGFPYPWCAKRTKKGWIVKDSPTGTEFVGWKTADKMFRCREVLMQRFGGKDLGKQHTTEEGAIGQQNKHCSVNDWFRHTQQVVVQRQQQAKEVEFQKKRKEHALEIRQERLKKKKKEQQEKLAALQKAKEMAIPMSPTRRKHKAMTPKRNQQASTNSVVLGDDPELDAIIEGIVLEFTQNQSGTLEGGNGLTFDGSAVSALREAARESLVAQQCSASNVSSNATDAAAIANSEKDEDVRIADMIEQIIGDVQQDSGCQFDGDAVEALRVAAQEMVRIDEAEVKED